MSADDNRGLKDRSRAFVVVVGTAALLAWFVLLWLMFRDVL